MREEALKYQESLEKGYLNRLEKRQESSPSSIQKKRFELEKWITKERSEVASKNEHINMFDLEHERQEAARIIEKVNQKAKEL